MLIFNISYIFLLSSLKYQCTKLGIIYNMYFISSLSVKVSLKTMSNKSLTRWLLLGFMDLHGNGSLKGKETKTF